MVFSQKKEKKKKSTYLQDFTVVSSTGVSISCLDMESPMTRVGSILYRVKFKVSDNTYC